MFQYIRQSFSQHIGNSKSTIKHNGVTYPNIEYSEHFINAKVVSNSDNSWVILCYYTPLKRKMAVKHIRIQQNQANYIIEAINGLAEKAGTEYAVKIYGLCFKETPASLELLICMQAMDLSLSTVYIHYKKNKIQFPENLLRLITCSLVTALGLFQDNNVMHRNVKPSNILINKNGKIKFCDFGMAKIINGNTTIQTRQGDGKYWPPERFRNKYKAKADIWSLGMTLVEIIYGEHPYKNLDDIVFEQLVTTENNFVQDTINKISDKCSDEVREFIEACLQKEENTRNSCDQLKSLSFLKATLGIKNRHKIIKKIIEVRKLMLGTGAYMSKASRSEHFATVT